MKRDGGIDRVAAERLQPRDGAFLVQADQPAEAHHIGGEDGGKLALHAGAGHGVRPCHRR